MTTLASVDRMRAVEAKGFGLDTLRLVERLVPSILPGEILVRIEAATFYRDLAIFEGSDKPDIKGGFVPGSDACGEVVDIAAGVGRFKKGDRVIPTYTQGWIDGRPTPEQRGSRTLGVPLDGVLQEFIAVPAQDAVAAPVHLRSVSSDLGAAADLHW